MNVRFTLVADGPTDCALIQVLTYLVRLDPRVEEIAPQFAHPSMLPRARDGLRARAAAAIEFFPSDLLFVHRDAEREPMVRRKQEISTALKDFDQVTVVPVVPVRMTEAWLLFDEAAIRRAAGNPSGSMPLDLPRLQDLETVTQPKDRLHDILQRASGRRGRALAKFDERQAAARVVDLITDFSPLVELEAFRTLKIDLKNGLDQIAAARSV